SYYRPRDIITMLVILQEISRDTRINRDHFAYKDFDDPNFKRRYSDYLLGEIKDHLMFYYGSEEYELFLKFFEFLGGKAEFSYEEYLAAYDRFGKSRSLVGSSAPKFMVDAATFLQFLYDLNVICYIEEPEY